TQVTKNAPPSTTIRRYDGDAASVQSLVSGQVETLGGNIFYMDRVEKARPGEFENKLDFLFAETRASTVIELLEFKLVFELA
ncbi:hypothetical protein ACC736_39090, partial [Rhizobium ruizarguesonis]